MKKIYFLVLVTLLAACNSSGPEVQDETFRVSRLFADGMVIQRNAEVPVWGYAPSGSDVSISLGSEVHESKAGTDGKWRVTLAPREAGGPHELAVVSGENAFNYSDVFFGDIWVASGQSNMEWAVANSNNASDEIASASDHFIREFKIPHATAVASEDELLGGAWNKADTAHVGAFSAVAYYFAKSLRQHVDVPIGIVNTSWGGTRIEPWMSPASYGADAANLAIEEALAEKEAAQRRIMIKFGGELPVRDMGLEAGIAHWAQSDLDDTRWDPINVPGTWEEQEYEGIDGIAWYRFDLDLDTDDVGDGSGTIRFGRIDDSDITWINGVEVGQMTAASNVSRSYDIAPGLLREGKNVVAVRVTDTGGAGGFRGSNEEFVVSTAQGDHPLNGAWKIRFGRVDFPEPRINHQLPTVIYNQMVHPLLPFPVTGFLWYQGESNASGEQAVAYSTQFKTMIEGWREAWSAADAPFLFVQLANYRAPSPEPMESDWAVLRESQSNALSLPRVAQAVIIDIGEANDIHPRNKQDVGERLSLAARHIQYGEEIVYSGPVYSGHSIVESRVIIEFDHVGSGLVARGNKLSGFSIAGQDGRFVWADARIQGETVVVSTSSISEPVSVRYAWADNPDKANLFNDEGLPASPFRTDLRK